MNTEFTRKVVEAAMLAAGRTLSLAELAQLFEPVDRPDADQLRAALAELGESYAGRGIELIETAQGFRVQVRREVSEQVSRLWPERPPRYSRALLETLAIVAYRQPLTRGEIENVRGVAVNPNIIKTLFERNWIRVVGHREVPGRPELLGTTRDFLDYFGLKSLDQLPPLSELKSLEEIDPQLALPVPLLTAVENGEIAALPAPEGEAEAADAVEVVEVVEVLEVAESVDVEVDGEAAGTADADSDADVASAPEAPNDETDEAAAPTAPAVSS